MVRFRIVVVLIGPHEREIACLHNVDVTPHQPQVMKRDDLADFIQDCSKGAKTPLSRNL
jgi:hypothetical protein